MNSLSVIIAFRNEGEELITTLEGIERTAGNNVDLILVNDASDDGRDYRSAAERYGAMYIENPARLGCAPSRDVGARACQTPKMFIVDAHMRFYDDPWWQRIDEAVDAHPESLFCCQTVGWDYHTKEEYTTKVGLGATIDITGSVGQNTPMELMWINSQKIDTSGPTTPVPCPNGANYASSVDWWWKIHGLRGLTRYGCDEQFMGLKTWMAGGECRLINNARIGHLFKKQFNFNIPTTEVVYNKIFMALTLVPEELRESVIRDIKSGYGFVDYISAMKDIERNREEIKYLENIYKETFKYGFERFEEINNRYL